MTRVLVVDDEPGFRRAWANAVSLVDKNTTVVELDNGELLASLKVLEARRLPARDGAVIETEATPLDACDVLIVDYDLAPISELGTLTGEAVSYLARTYSSATVLVLLNAVSESFFDLTLRGDSESFADLNVGSHHVGSPGLWSAEVSGFRPWHWPVIPTAVGAQTAFAEFLIPRLDQPLLNVLALEGQPLSRAVRSLVDAATSEDSVTVKEYVLRGPTGVRRKDALTQAQDIARVAAARLRRWLESDVISSQDVLVDAPHLVSRFPSLLVESPDDHEAWNETAHPGPATGLRTGEIDAHRYPLSPFLSRDVWFWTSLRADKSIPEVAKPFSARTSPFLFCEDVSRFLMPEATREFVADVAGDYVRRFLVDPDTAGGSAYADAIRMVDLRPLSRLSMR